MKTVVTDTKAAPAIARAVPALMARREAWFEEKLPAEQPAKPSGQYQARPKIEAYALGVGFSSKRYLVSKSPSSNIAMQGTLFPQLRCSKTAPDGGR